MISEISLIHNQRNSFSGEKNLLYSCRYGFRKNFKQMESDSFYMTNFVLPVLINTQGDQKLFLGKYLKTKKPICHWFFRSCNGFICIFSSDYRLCSVFHTFWDTWLALEVNHLSQTTICCLSIYKRNLRLYFPRKSDEGINHLNLNLLTHVFDLW